MDLDSLIVTIFCTVDDALAITLDGKPLRKRGPRPLLADAEVLIIETVGEYLGLDSAKREKHRWPLFLVQKRRRIETVIGQLVERFHAKRVWARDRWHFFSRWLRKVMAHTLFVQLCQQHELLLLRFAGLVTN